MGNRILKEDIRMSRDIDALSTFEENVFYRLLVTADDYGIYSANPVVLAHILYPLKENIDRKTMQKALDHLKSQGLILCYHVEGKGEFLKIASWEKHQRLRNSQHRFPMPEEADGDPEETDEPAKEEQPETQPGEDSLPVPAETRELPVIELPLNDNSTYGVTRTEAEEYARLYPAVDVAQELRNMRGWCLSNSQRRKTRSGIRKFITNWLARAQDKGGGPGGTERGAPENPFLKAAMGEGDGDESGNALFTDWFGKGAVQ